MPSPMRVLSLATDSFPILSLWYDDTGGPTLGMAAAAI